jgi:exodeoxyribonuclease VII large subunit
LQQLRARLASAAGRPLRDAQARLAMVRLRWQRWRPDLSAQRASTAGLARQLATAFERQRERRASTVAGLAARLEVLSPQRTLERGYAALIDVQTGRAVRAPSALKRDKRLTIHVAEGSVDVTLKDVQPRLADDF